MNERDIFFAAIEITDPAERSAYLDQACGDNMGLRAQVEELLKTHNETSQFLETPAVATASAVDRTVLTDASDTDEDSGDVCDSGEAEFRKYLEPATRPGWLGRLAHYEIEEILGRGAFGIVAKAFDEKLHRVVAIKLMSPELALTSPPRKRFLREARTAAAVTHENIVAIHAVEEEPIPYLVMEYISGETLQQRMDGHGPLEVPDVLRIGQQVASGMAAAHAVNLIHRDIKPSNILLSDGPTSRVKISDFGLARAVDDASMTKSGMIAGTPMYMAPEQARGETLDHRADLFSLGSVLYQMAGGRPPFRAANTVAVLKRVCEDTPRPLDDVLPGTPDWLETIIFKLLEKERDDRYQTAQEVADLLARCQSELEHNGKVTCVEGRSGMAEAQVFHAKKLTGSALKKKPLGWLVGGVVAVAAVIGIVLMNGGREAPVPDATAPDRTVAEQQEDDLLTRGQPIDLIALIDKERGFLDANAPPPAIAPFNAEQAKAHQEAWAKYLGVPVKYENSIGMKFVLIPPGNFVMGLNEEFEQQLQVSLQANNHSRSSALGSLPRRRIQLTKPFFLGMHEVTFAQFEQFVLDTRYKTVGETNSIGGAIIFDRNPDWTWRSPGTSQPAADDPVSQICWSDAIAFCDWLSRQDGLRYTLPTEAQWEFACSAGSTTGFNDNISSHDEIVTYAHLRRGTSLRELKPASVGQHHANAFGLHDMHGNLWEWCHDFWSPNHNRRALIDPTGPDEGRSHVLKGGAFDCPHWNAYSASRMTWTNDVPGWTFGFRVALAVDEVKDRLSEKPATSSKN